jgi:hypothetical protein
MTQTLDALDAAARFAQRDSARAAGAPSSAMQKSESRFGIFAITFGIAFAVLYTAFERLNWPLFTYHPVSGAVDFWRESVGTGPPMFWYGWLILAAASAAVVGAVATFVPERVLRQATFFCCVLAALWPAFLVGLRSFGADWASLDAEYMNSPWAALVPALVASAAIGYFVPAQFVQRVWTSLLLIAPIGGLVVLGNSLMPYFTH